LREKRVSVTVLTLDENTSPCRLCRSQITCLETSWLVKWMEPRVSYEHYCDCCYAVLRSRPGFGELGFPRSKKDLTRAVPRWFTRVPVRLLACELERLRPDRLRPFWPKGEELKRFRKFIRAIKGGFS
jgi:hypothetical protein